MTAVTPAAWTPNLTHTRYGTIDTYRIAADWLKDCADVADWGAGSGFLQLFLDPSIRYVPVDGTPSFLPNFTLADLACYRQPSDGIALRHVMDMTEDWRAVLENALAAFRRRMVVITFTPDAETTRVWKRKSGWPVWHFNPDDLRQVMGAALVRDYALRTSHPERVYLLERPA